MVRNSRKNNFLAALTGAALLLGAGPGRAAEDKAASERPAPKHHSKLKGAVVGGAAGAVVGGKKGAAAGAVGGALYQRHKNKKAEKAAKQGQ